MEYLLGFFLSIFGAIVSNAIGSHQASTARRETFEFNEKAAENADSRTRALYNDIGSPEQQITSTLNGLKNNGLSPSVFYSGGSVSGQTMNGAQGGGAGNFMPNVFGIDSMQGAQIRLAEAQAKNLEADTELKKEETEVKTVEINKILAEADLSKSQTTYNNVMTEIAKANKANTVNLTFYEAKKAKNEAEKLINEARQTNLRIQFTEETWNEAKDLIKEEVKNMIQDTLVKKSQKELNEKQWDYLQNQMDMQISEMFRQWHLVDLEDMRVDAYIKQVNAGIENMQKEIAYKYDQLGFENKQMWVNFFGDLVHTGATIAGITFLKTGTAKNVGIEKGSSLVTAGRVKALKSQFEKMKDKEFLNKLEW